MPISLRQRHPCQRRLAVLRVIHCCFRSSRVEGREGCIDVGWYKHFQRGFLTNDRRFVAGDARQYDDRGYSSGHDSAGNSDPGAPRRARFLPARRLLTWRPVLLAGCARGNLMLCFCLTHVRASSIAGTEIMVDGRSDDNSDSGRQVVERRQVRLFPPSCFVPVSVSDRGKLVDKLLSQSYDAERALGHSSRFVVSSFHSYHRVRRLTWQKHKFGEPKASVRFWPILLQKSVAADGRSTISL
jgi:hypothetical protein